MKIGFVAPSAKVPSVEFRMGLKMIEEAGFELQVHPQCRKAHLYFAGRDSERAAAFYQYARDPQLDALWCARGGSGAGRLLPLLRELTKKKGKPPRKLLLGYSDATALHEFVRREWGWATLHSPMPGMRRFCAQTPAEWKGLVSFLRRKGSVSHELKFLTKPAKDVTSELVGGNLSVWVSLIGTSFEPKTRGKIVFIEDIGENLYRLDRMVQQLVQSGGLDGARAIVLGNFLDCVDTVPQVLAKVPPAGKLRETLQAPPASILQPLRPRLTPAPVIRDLFREVGKTLGIPVAEGLPVGHGPEIASLPLGARYRLARRGRLELVSWDWVDRPALFR